LTLSIGACGSTSSRSVTGSNVGDGVVLQLGLVEAWQEKHVKDEGGRCQAWSSQRPRRNARNTWNAREPGVPGEDQNDISYIARGCRPT